MSAGIVVGYDGSDCAKHALRTAIELAKALGEEVIVTFGYELSPLGGEVRDYSDSVRELAHKRVTEAGELANSEDVKVEAVVAEQDPAAALVSVAEERDARLIVVGSHGERPLSAALLRSVPHKLLHLSHRPVLVVPHDG
jgi:nucleotide-binding universal stress UspA family protein